MGPSASEGPVTGRSGRNDLRRGIMGRSREKEEEMRHREGKTKQLNVQLLNKYTKALETQ